MVNGNLYRLENFLYARFVRYEVQILIITCLLLNLFQGSNIQVNHIEQGFPCTSFQQILYLQTWSTILDELNYV